MTTFTHTPRPACAQSGKYARQRRYGPPDGLGNGHPQPLTHGETTFGVYRDAHKQVASMEVRIGSVAFLDFDLTPEKLRELAARLLDAAHDIETNPAAKLREALAAEQATA